jgi:site-specific recombinase XerD
VKLSLAIDVFISDMRLEGRINSAATERDYRGTLEKHADDVGNRDPRYVGRDDVKRTLARWPHPNSQRKNRSILISFYDWLVQEGERPHNPARQTRRPKRRPTETYRLSKPEVVRLLGAVRGERERRAIYLGLCAGLRRQELLGLQGRHFMRDGFVWVSADIAKGQRERWVPVVAELAPVVADIRRTLELDDYVLPAQRWRDPGVNRERVVMRKHPMSPKALWELVGRVGIRAGVAGHMRPHLLRHAYADHIARQAGVRTAQFLLGHANLGTTETYLGKPTRDELQTAVAGFAFGVVIEHTFNPLAEEAANPVEAPTGIEPVYTALQAAA